jgi:hypothetical protein
MQHRHDGKPWFVHVFGRHRDKFWIAPKFLCLLKIDPVFELVARAFVEIKFEIYAIIIYLSNKAATKKVLKLYYFSYIGLGGCKNK